MATLMQANRQWSTRPEDERFVSLKDMSAHFRNVRESSVEKRISVKDLRAIEDDSDSLGLKLVGPSGNPLGMSNWAFRQLTIKAGVPTEYLTRLPGDLAARNLNHGIQSLNVTDDDDFKVNALLSKTDGGAIARAFTGVDYGRVWCHQVSDALVERFGDGVTGDWKVPGEFGKKVKVTKANTTLFASDRDMFVFLADEDHRIDVPNRRNGEPGSLARGFFVWNSDVGAQTLGVGFFLFDYVCSNRIVWGAQEYKEMRFRHTKNIDQRWIHEMGPTIMEYGNSLASPIEAQIQRAQAFKLEKPEEFLSDKMGLSAKLSRELVTVHKAEENDRPIETLWDATTAITAYAKSIPNNDDRVKLERVGGKILDLVAA